jgi:hypothetical protein
MKRVPMLRSYQKDFLIPGKDEATPEPTTFFASLQHHLQSSSRQDVIRKAVKEI